MQFQIGYIPIEFIVISSVVNVFYYTCRNMVYSHPLECILI
jgi:hypothetical protein